MQILLSGCILIFSRFGNTQKTAVQLLGLVPSITVSRTDANIDAISKSVSFKFLKLRLVVRDPLEHSSADRKIAIIIIIIIIIITVIIISLLQCCPLIYYKSKVVHLPQHLQDVHRW